MGPNFVDSLEVQFSRCQNYISQDQFKVKNISYVKGQIILECPLEILDFPKIPPKIWQISALESKKEVKS